MSLSYSSGPSSEYGSSSRANSDAASTSDSVPLLSSLSKTKESIRDALYDDIPVEEFVQHVWGLRDTDVERILDGKHYWNISQTFLKDYKDAYGRMNENSLAARRAGNAFAAFLDIAEEVLRHIRIRIHDAIRRTNSVAFKHNPDCSNGDIPDIATVWGAASKPEWPIIQTMFEFERPLPLVANEQAIDNGVFRADIFAADSPFFNKHTPTSSCASSSTSCSSSSTSCTTNASHLSGRDGSDGSGGDVIGGDGSYSRTWKRSKRRINHGELRLAQKALECMCSVGRRYMTGIYIDVCSVTLWYYDRMSIIRSRSFNFEHSPAYLVLVLYAITRCDVYQSGYDQFHEFPNTPFGTQMPTTSHKGNRLVIPISGASYCFQMTRDKPIYNSRELTGRGTMVYPVILQPDEDEVIINEEEQVFKMYWPNVDDPLEADTIKRLHHDVPEIADHLPSISFSASFTSDELDLPSSRLKAYAGSAREERLLHMFTMKRYEKLWEVDSIEEFQQVFLDCVECHYHAYKKGHVLHRDLSENNLMVWRPKRGGTVVSQGSNNPPSSTHARAMGILNDWDMSSRVAKYSGMASVVTSLSSEPDVLNNRTGTLPFMALDLLAEDGPAPRHLYRHDLESFLWILIWAAVHYDIPNKKNMSILSAEIDRELRIWDEATRGEVWASKRVLLRRESGGSPRSSSGDSSHLQDALDRVRPEFQIIKTEWIIPLMRMFHQAYNELRYTDVDEETCGGIVTFHTFMGTINRTPRLVPNADEDRWGHCVIS